MVDNEKENVKGVKDSKDVDEKVKKFVQEFHAHGMGCGIKIAEIARFLHPNALLIVPLYRSCIVVEQSEQEQADGSCTVHGYADPHWLGGEIDAETLKSDDFHFIYEVHGDRQGPAIVKIEKDQMIMEDQMITPHVTGKIALMLEKDPDLTPAQIKEMMDKEMAEMTEMTDKEIADKDTISKEK